MKNSLYVDLVNEAERKLKEHHEFSVKYGGKLDKEQKEKFKERMITLIDGFEEREE